MTTQDNIHLVRPARQLNALLIVDLQNDFLPNGALSVVDGEQIIPVVNLLMHLPFDLKLASKDWHPANHISFASTHNKSPGECILLEGREQILWPVHCVQATKGAKFAEGWDYSKIDNIFYKGTNRHVDSYSTFFDNHRIKSTGLGEYLQSKGITDIYIAGLAIDYCVKFSVLDAIKLGFTVHVVTSACRGVNLHSNDSEKAYEEMQQAGAKLIL